MIKTIKGKLIYKKRMKGCYELMVGRTVVWAVNDFLPKDTVDLLNEITPHQKTPLIVTGMLSGMVGGLVPNRITLTALSIKISWPHIGYSYDTRLENTSRILPRHSRRF